MTARRNESGAVTAETATVIPILLLLAAVLAWMVAFGVTEVRAVDAAREVARALARGEDEAVSLRLGRRVAPSGSRIVVDRQGDSLVVRVTVDVHGPRGLFGHLPGHRVEAEAVAEREPA